MSNEVDEFNIAKAAIFLDILNKEPFNTWNRKLKKELKSSRYEHSIGVLNAAVALAQRYGENVEEVSASALLHDCAKHNEGKILKYLNDKGCDISKYKPSVNLHAELGAIWAREFYGLNKAVCLAAIKKHTLADKEMSNLDKIIYVADMIEIGRDYKGLKKLRKAVFEDLDKGYLACLNRSIKYLIKIDKYIEPRTFEARNAAIIKMKSMGKLEK